MTCCLLSWHLVSVCFLGRKKTDKLTSATAHRHQHRHQDFYCVSSVCVSEDVWVLESRKRELKLSSTRHTWDSFLSPGSGSRRSDGPVTRTITMLGPSLLFEMAPPVPSQRNGPTANFRCWEDVEPTGHRGHPQESRIWLALWHWSATQRASKSKWRGCHCCTLCSGSGVVAHRAATVYRDKDMGLVVT